MSLPIRIPILFRYIFREIVVPFSLAVSVLTGVLFIARVLKLVDLVVNKSVPLWDVVLLFSYVVPSFLEMAIPMAVLLGILIAFSRLSADSELIVIRAAGVSFRELLIPPAMFAVLATLLCLGISCWLRPTANNLLGLGMFQIAKDRASAGLPSGVFTEFGPLTMYAEQVDPATGHLQNVLISDRRDGNMPRNFFAQWGEMLSDASTRTVSLQLFQGSIHEGTGETFTVTKFNINNIRVPQDELLDAGERSGRTNELGMFELYDRIQTLKANPSRSRDDDKQLGRTKVELHRRIVIPFACLSVALLGVALGIQPARGTRTWGTTANIVIGISCILLYYFALALVSAIAEKPNAATGILLWIPNILVFLISLFLIRQIELERWQSVSHALGDGMARVGRIFKKSPA